MPYLVMPYVKGGTLKEKMGQPMPYREAAALLAPIAQAWIMLTSEKSFIAT